MHKGLRPKRSWRCLLLFGKLQLTHIGSWMLMEPWSSRHITCNAPGTRCAEGVAMHRTCTTSLWHRTSRPWRSSRRTRWHMCVMRSGNVSRWTCECSASLPSTGIEASACVTGLTMAASTACCEPCRRVARRMVAKHNRTGGATRSAGHTRLANM